MLFELDNQQSQRKVNEAAEVTLSSMLLIAVFDEMVETCDRHSLGLLQSQGPINDGVVHVCYHMLFVNENSFKWCALLSVSRENTWFRT